MFLMILYEIIFVIIISMKKTNLKLASVLIAIIIVPFVFWGMGGMFSSGNTNNVAKINKLNISTQDLINHINRSNIPDKTIRENLDKNISSINLIHLYLLLLYHRE